MSDRPTVKIVSGGDARNTHVTIDGAEVFCSKATWTCDADGFATATLEFPFVEVEIVGEAKQAEPLRILASEREFVERWLRYHRSGVFYPAPYESLVAGES